MRLGPVASTQHARRLRGDVLAWVALAMLTPIVGAVRVDGQALPRRNPSGPLASPQAAYVRPSGAPLWPVIHRCLAGQGVPVELQITVVVAGNGAIDRVLTSPRDSALGACIAREAAGLLRLPRDRMEMYVFMVPPRPSVHWLD